MSDWRDITDGREKYAAYLCSREWGLLREAVHERADGICERCKKNPIDHVHHLTYARKYEERLSDLQGRCKECHEYGHGRSDIDPSEGDGILSFRNVGFVGSSGNAFQSGYFVDASVAFRFEEDEDGTFVLRCGVVGDGSNDTEARVSCAIDLESALKLVKYIRSKIKSIPQLRRLDLE